MDQKYRKESLVLDPAGLPRTLRPRYELTKSLLDGIVATLPSDNPYAFSLAVTQADESNASVGPGGFVYVTTGMLQDKTLDRNDIALRLSHEVAHMTRRHALKEVQVKVVDSLEISKSVKPLLDFAQDPVRVMETLFGTMKATELMFQRFDQVQELEGDALRHLSARAPQWRRCQGGGEEVRRSARRHGQDRMGCVTPGA